MPGMTMTVSGHTLSRILRDVAKGCIPVDKLALRSQMVDAFRSNASFVKVIG